MQENLGTPGDVDFQRMIRDFREDHEDEAQEVCSASRNAAPLPRGPLGVLSHTGSTRTLATSKFVFAFVSGPSTRRKWRKRTMMRWVPTPSLLRRIFGGGLSVLLACEPQVTCLNPKVIVHACKLKVDGITKYLDNTSFQFDHVSGPMCRGLSALLPVLAGGPCPCNRPLMNTVQPRKYMNTRCSHWCKACSLTEAAEPALRKFRPLPPLQC